MRQREIERAIRQSAVVQPPVIFHPSGVARVGVQVLRADVMVLPVHHAAQAS
jgi:hypothetical protein